LLAHCTGVTQMQTFLPYPSFEDTAKVLDYKRLGKQRVEGYQILNTLGRRQMGITTGAWVNHPAVIMWTGYELSLIKYCISITDEWIKRGYNDTMLPRFNEYYSIYKDMGYAEEYPRWLGDDRLHISHQSNLMRKDPSYYHQRFNVPDDIPYFWPSENP
jgi:hypothetical protein